MEGIGKEGAMFSGKGSWKNWKFGQDSVMREGIGKEGAMFSGKGGWKNWKFGQDSVLFLKFRRREDDKYSIIGAEKVGNLGSTLGRNQFYKRGEGGEGLWRRAGIVF